MASPAVEPPLDDSEYINYGTSPAPEAAAESRAGVGAADGGADSAADAGGNNASGERSTDGTYVPATAESAAQIPTFKKKRRADDDEGGDDDDADEEREARKKRKAERAARRNRADAEVEDEDLGAEPEMDERSRRRLELEERIDNVGKKPRAPRRKKKRGNEDEDIVDSYHDEICARLRDRMSSAADKDATANRNKLPATNKLAMLDEVVRVLQNTTLWSSIIDSDVLKSVQQWLEPLPDKSLPAVGIQNAIFEVLPKMELDTTTIREAGLGPIVLFYTKTKRVTPEIKRAADQLVQAWSRPIIKRPADFRSRHVATADNGADDEPEGELLDEDGEPSQRSSQRRSTQGGNLPKPKRFNVDAALKENASLKGARMPVVNEVQYTVAPESRLQHHAEDIAHVSRIQLDNRKFNRFARQLKSRKV